MAETTGISWADATWSPWTGCTRVSPACDGCYAAHLMDTRMHRVEWGEPGAGEGTRSLMSDEYWRKPLAWNREAGKTGVRPWVFPSLCDPFDTAVPSAWRWRFVELMEATPNVLWLLLTKRLGNIIKLTDPARGERPLPSNVALGGTFANQAEWDRDWLKLRDAQMATGAIFTFGSFEPLLGPVDILKVGWMPAWVIAGGETDQGAHKARPSHPQWFATLRDQCAVAGVPFHFKQWGEWKHGSDFAADAKAVLNDGAVSDPTQDALKALDRIASVPSRDPTMMRRVGKSRAGRLLDGVLHDARPSLAHGACEDA